MPTLAAPLMPLQKSTESALDNIEIREHCALRNALFSLSKNFQYASVSDIIKETGVFLWSNGEKMQEVKRSSWI